jgi:hypothetical protein
MNRSSFSADPAGLPAHLAAELEEHRMVFLEAGLRSGMCSEESRRTTLRSLGAPFEVAHRCLRESDPSDPKRVPTTPQQQVAILGWMILGIGFASRVCAAPDPSHGSIAGCVGLSVGSLALALLIRRDRIPLRLAAGLSLGLTAAATVGLLQAAWHPRIQDSLALTPAAMGSLALFGALSSGTLTPPPRRTA